jgi:hypothetical protein
MQIGQEIFQTGNPRRVTLCLLAETWRSKKQNVVALSSAEAEFRGMAKGLCELLWLKRLLT